MVKESLTATSWTRHILFLNVTTGYTRTCTSSGAFYRADMLSLFRVMR